MNSRTPLSITGTQANGKSDLSGLDAVIDDVLEIIAVSQVHAGAHHLPHALSVERVPQIPVVQRRLLVGVGGGQLQFAHAHGQVQHAQHTHAQGLRQ